MDTPAMPPPLTAETRAAVEAAIRAGDLSYNAIARAHGCATSTVSRIARNLATTQTIPNRAAQQAQTKNAREARLAQLAERRVGEAVAAFEDAVRLRRSMFEERPRWVGKGDDGHFEDMLPEPRDIKDLAIAYGILHDKSRQLAAPDQSDPAEQGKAAVLQLVDVLRGRASARQEREAG